MVAPVIILDRRLFTKEDDSDNSDESDDLPDDDMDPVINVIILKNIKDLVMDHDSGMLLTTCGTVCEIGKRERPSEKDSHIIRGPDERFTTIADNVKEIGTTWKYSYYVKTDNSLYVRNNHGCLSERMTAKFEFVATVRAVHVRHDNIYYINLENRCFRNFGPMLDVSINIQHLLVYGQMWYFIHDDGVLTYFDVDRNKAWTIAGQYDQIFVKVVNLFEHIIYMVATDLSLYQLNHHEDKTTRTYITDNVLSVSNGYFIALPLSENFNVKPMSQFQN